LSWFFNVISRLNIFKPPQDFLNLYLGHNTKSSSMTSYHVKEQEVCGSVNLEAVSKTQIRFKSKAQADPPSLKKLWRDR
jgi:hypothetical protein